MQEQESLGTSDISLEQVVSQLEEVVEATHFKVREAGSDDIRDFLDTSSRDRIHQLEDKIDDLRRQLSALSEVNTVTEKSTLASGNHQRKLVRPDSTGALSRETIRATVRAVHVVAEDGKWLVRKAGVDRVQREFRKEDKAEQFAISLALTEGVNIVFHDETGKTQEIYVQNSGASAGV